MAKVSREPDLQQFLNLVEDAIDGRAGTDQIRMASRRVFSTLRRRAGPAGVIAPRQLPVCAHLAAVLDETRKDGSPVSELCGPLSKLLPRLCWSRRANADPANQPFFGGHANAMIVGPSGLEERGDVWVGISLMAPHVTYVDHDHPPEEIYLALTPGEWWNSDMDWTEPGIGGLIYNRPGIRHAMRSGAKPFLAIWCLPVP